MSRTLAELTARVERVSDIYAERCDIARDDDWYALKLTEEAGELVAAWLKATGRGRIGATDEAARWRNLEDEAADLLAQLLLFASHNGIDLDAALKRKWFSYLEEEQ